MRSVGRSAATWGPVCCLSDRAPSERTPSDAMSRIVRWARGLHRRWLWQVLLIYVGVGWGILQAADLFIERLGFPDWLFPGVLGLLLLGAPVVLLTAAVSAGAAGGEGTMGGDLRPGVGAPTQGAGTNPQGRLVSVFTWRNALGAGVLAFALLGIASVAETVVRKVAGDPVAWARETGLPELDRLVSEAKLDSAWWVGRRVELAIPEDPIFLSLRERYSAVVDVTTEPTGARFRYRILSAIDTSVWEFTGTTPQRGLRVPGVPTPMLLEFDAPGRETVRVVTSFARPFPSLGTVSLPPESSVPEGFVHVGGGS